MPWWIGIPSLDGPGGLSAAPLIADYSDGLRRLLENPLSWPKSLSVKPAHMAAVGDSPGIFQGFGSNMGKKKVPKPLLFALPSWLLF
jgi:hypothetical protein